jgi:hypothetical protein
MPQGHPEGGFLIVPPSRIGLAYAVVLLTAVLAFWLLAGFPLITYHL